MPSSERSKSRLSGAHEADESDVTVEPGGAHRRVGQLGDGILGVIGHYGSSGYVAACTLA